MLARSLAHSAVGSTLNVKSLFSPLLSTSFKPALKYSRAAIKDLKTPKARDATKISPGVFFVLQTVHVLSALDVVACPSSLPAAYFNRPCLKILYWLPRVPYFRIKNPSIQRLLLFIFFSHDEATDVLNLISKAWLLEDTCQKTQ